MGRTKCIHILQYSFQTGSSCCSSYFQTFILIASLEKVFIGNTIIILWINYTIIISINNYNAIINKNRGRLSRPYSALQNSCGHTKEFLRNLQFEHATSKKVQKPYKGLIWRSQRTVACSCGQDVTRARWGLWTQSELHTSRKNSYPAAQVSNFSTKPVYCT